MALAQLTGPMSDRLVRTSKYLSYVLRHNPGALGLEFEPGGWVSVDTLLRRARNHGRDLDRALLEEAVQSGQKTRFSLSEDGTKIRANYGHSVDVNLDLEPTAPPRHLYHGTAEHTLESIVDEGVQPQSRQFVHLSSTRDEALRVGRRHGSPVVLVVSAEQLHESGQAFYRTTDAVWLTRRIPPNFLREDGS